MKKIELGFVQKIVLLHFFAMLSIVLFAGMYFQLSTRDQIESSELKKATQIAENTASTVAALLELNLDREISIELNNTVQKNISVNAITLIDQYGKKIDIKQNEGDSYGDYFEANATIIGSNGHTQIGTINVLYSKSDYTSIVNKQLQIFLILIALAIISATISSIYVRKKLAPLQKLADNLIDTDIHNPNLIIELSDNHDEISIIQNKIRQAFEKITDYQKEIEHVNLNLEHLVELRTTKLKKALEDLQEKDEMLVIQSRFSAMGEMIANIAHQWRQPLNIIKGSASILLFYKQLGKLDVNVVAEHSQSIQKQVDYLSQTIEDFRDFYKDDEQSQFSVSESISKAIDLISSAMKNNFIKLHLIQDGDAMLTGSQSRLVQVLVNILNNAKDIIVETKTSGVIMVKLISRVEGSSIEIIDNAGGIRQDVIDRIFEPYFTTKHKSQGTGLGLYMAKQIIEKHFRSRIMASNKEFEVDGEKYYGAAFRIVFTDTVNI